MFNMVELYEEFSPKRALRNCSINISIFFSNSLAQKELKICKEPFCLEDSAFLYSFSSSPLIGPFVQNYTSVGLAKITERLPLSTSKRRF